MTILSIGEILWDVFEDAEHLGGAPFNLAAHARRLGHEVLFLSAVGDDERGRAALAKAAELGLSTEFIRVVRDAPTGIVSVRLNAAGQPSFTIHRPAAYDYLQLDTGDLERISSLRPEWICFGTLHQIEPRIKELVRRLMESNPGARRFYDINLRRDSYTPALVQELMRLANVVKLNEEEAAEVNRRFGSSCDSTEEFCRSYARRFDWEAVCVTRGEKGCAILAGDGYAVVDGYTVQVQDTVGAGDAFAAAFLHGLARGWAPGEIGDLANRVGALVASRAGAVPLWTLEECEALARS